MTRNVFDQYKQAENRLTHALLCTLANDRGLRSKFLSRYVKDVRFNRRVLKVAEQTNPGIPEPTIEDEPSKSLPDGVIFEDLQQDKIGKTDRDTRRALIIESKITSRLTNDQLERHSNGLRARGFVVTGLTITADTIRTQLPGGWSGVSWADLYHWLSSQPSSSIWLSELKHFFEVLEAQMVNDNSLGDRALTRFNGIPFGLEHRYTYPEAKRLLRLLRAKILKQKGLCNQLEIAPDALGRTAITDDQGTVWDFFSMTAYPKGKRFTSYPHLSFAIEQTKGGAYITVPDKVGSDIIRHMRKASAKEFQNAVTDFLASIKNTKNIRPMLLIQQRRYRTQRSTPLHDAVLDVDLRTALKAPRSRKNHQGPKYQPEWLELAQKVMKHKASNLELQIGCAFDYERCPAVHKSDAEMLFVNAWSAARKFFTGIHVDM